MTATFLHTMVRITDPERSRAFYEELGFTFARDLDIVRNGEKEATNYFFSLGDQDAVLELTYNYDGHAAMTWAPPMGTSPSVWTNSMRRSSDSVQQGIEPEKPPYSVREGGSRLCFVRDPDGYRIEIIERP